jgi:glutamate 5-kinase
MVIKVGTRLLTDRTRIPELIAGIARVRDSGRHVLLVSSGAVGIGMTEMALKKRPGRLSEVQALAAIGQCKLMSLYDEECREHDFKSAQLLLTANDLQDRERHLNIVNCINSLWSQGILPIVNENDSVSIDELKFGDNDNLAGLLAAMTKSELTVILTTEEGLREKHDGVLGKRISIVENICDKLKASATGTDDAELSIGGMVSKLHAAETVTAAGEALWIADGRVKGILEDILKADDVGTLFVPKASQMQAKKRWLNFFSKSAGTIIVDSGAAKALSERGKSLLPAGITAVKGDFQRGDTIEICDADGNMIGRGLANFDAADCKKIIGCQGHEIAKILNRNADEVVVHRDNLVISAN